MRKATVVRWPGRIPAGGENAELMTAMDLLPTFAALAGAEVPGDRVIDGRDISAVLQGEAKSPHETFFYHRGNDLKAVRSGGWKLHSDHGKPAALLHLRDDIAENNRPAAFAANPVPLSQ